MIDPAGTFPDQNQYDLLAAHGFGEAFCGYWIERGDLDELATLLRLDPASRRDQDLATAAADMSNAVDIYDPSDLWIGPHSPGWSVVICSMELQAVPEGVIPGARRLLEVSWTWDIDGLHDLSFCQGDKLIAQIPAFPWAFLAVRPAKPAKSCWQTPSSPSWGE
ncbi:hypothetical protein ACIBG7_27265 [Nonomuraea sp. NPDC050328]|uniref:hypothetical protein n=1 Tax=Nonomuraea sp. NPDC050328 TaxID=3364361 RepID=UPI0037BBC368